MLSLEYLIKFVKSSRLSAENLFDHDLAALDNIAVGRGHGDVDSCCKAISSYVYSSGSFCAGNLSHIPFVFINVVINICNRRYSDYFISIDIIMYPDLL